MYRIKVFGCSVLDEMLEFIDGSFRVTLPKPGKTLTEENVKEAFRAGSENVCSSWWKATEHMGERVLLCKHDFQQPCNCL